ncbi:hypothetical protein QC764_0059400 [Podospora pseudoanserina]|uniref:Uncharacterized protein n=1 Tax=Podospora pseudoanserina TaxID=2609844 RepID=A0ABR0IEM4_9PEZI|nr:hypothetical protein QC764_0059400 [Podospora pseudoanserina]
MATSMELVMDRRSAVASRAAMLPRFGAMAIRSRWWEKELSRESVGSGASGPSLKSGSRSGTQGRPSHFALGGRDLSMQRLSAARWSYRWRQQPRQDWTPGVAGAGAGAGLRLSGLHLELAMLSLTPDRETGEDWHCSFWPPVLVLSQPLPRAGLQTIGPWS